MSPRFATALALATSAACRSSAPTDARPPSGTSSGTSTTSESSGRGDDEHGDADAATATSGDSSSSGDPSAFIRVPDGGGRHVECDLWEQDCARGEKCMPCAHEDAATWNGTTCSPIARDPSQPGEPCSAPQGVYAGLDDCDIRSMCLHLDPATGAGICVAFCTGTPANPVCEDPNAECSISGEGVLLLCIPHCDPVLQNCPMGHGCYPSAMFGFSCGIDVSGPSGVRGDSCEFDSSCDPGLACAAADQVEGCEASGCCTPFCDVDLPQCPPATVCAAWYDAGQAPPGEEHVGVCVLPEGG